MKTKTTRLPYDDDYEELAIYSCKEGNDVSLKRDEHGVFHIVAFLTTLDDRVVPQDVPVHHYLASQGVGGGSPRVGLMRYDQEISFEEAARWCIQKLVPPQFHARFLGEK